LGPLGVAVNVVTPAFTLTDASMIMPEEYRERVRQTRPLQRHLYPEDVAGAIAFLAGDEASMLTGSNILITGGSHLQLQWFRRSLKSPGRSAPNFRNHAFAG